MLRLEWRRPSCPVLTVAGTNGKGSTVALATRILREAGYRVGAFTSPHLVRYNERITVDEVEVSDASLIAAFERIDAARGSDTLTFFEFNTLAALLVFETATPDVILLEVGMGGRLDAVNVVDADIAVVTSIALDHCEWLGPDAESIGREKAGIFRARRPAIYGARTMPASIADTAATTGADLWCLGRDFDYEAGRSDWCWRGRSGRYERLRQPALSGQQQYDNASTVLAALEAISERLPVSRTAIDRGLRSVRLAGRFQRVSAEVEWILDVAHNPAAAAKLAGQLNDEPSAGRTIAVLGILGDKDIQGVLREVSGSFDAYIVAGLGGQRALTAHALADRVTLAGQRVLAVVDNVADACETAANTVRPGDRVVVFGSFMTVGPALEWLRKTGRLDDSGELTHEMSAHESHR